MIPRSDSIFPHTFVLVSVTPFRMEMGKEPLVKTVANIFKHLCYDYRDQITAGIIVAGWDSKDGGQVPHSVDQTVFKVFLLCVQGTLRQCVSYFTGLCREH